MSLRQCLKSHTTIFQSCQDEAFASLVLNMSRIVRKQDFADAKIKAQISFAATAKLISAFVFTTLIV